MDDPVSNHERPRPDEHERTTPEAERATDYRENMRAHGYRQVLVWLPKSLKVHIKGIADHEGHTLDEMIEILLKRAVHKNASCSICNKNL